jgi:hypothetical protein
MPNRVLSILWVAAALLTLYFGIRAEGEPEVIQRIPLMVLVASVTLAAFTPARGVVAAPLRALRRQPILHWLVVLGVICIGIGIWLVGYQPTYGRVLKSLEYTWLCFLLWLVLTIIAFGLDAAQSRAMAASLGKSRLTGWMIAATTLAILFFGAEGWLRLFYITTDGYGFTAMNYHWYVNFYWGEYNSLGFRDDEPKPDPDHRLTRVGILGDSFAVGHGLTDRNQSFPQLLERELGDGYDVLVIAHSGWDSDVHAAQLDAYPLQPDIVVLSYYLNDIDYLLAGDANPDANFDFIQNETLHWFVLNFFTPNFVYYNLLQFTSTARTGNFIADLVNAHTNDDIWLRHTPNLQAVIDWTTQHDARLIVLLWHHLLAPDGSQPAVERVREYFESRGVTVVSMSEVLAGRNPYSLIVNRFDAHPGVEAQRAAADALYAAITHMESQP